MMHWRTHVADGNLPVYMLRLGENGLKIYRLAMKWEQFKIVLLFMDHPVIYKKKKLTGRSSTHTTYYLILHPPPPPEMTIKRS